MCYYLNIQFQGQRVKQTKKRSQDNLVSIVMSPRAGRSGAGILAYEGNFYLLRNVPFISRTNSAICSTGTGPLSLT